MRFLTTFNGKTLLYCSALACALIVERTSHSYIKDEEIGVIFRMKIGWQFGWTIILCECLSCLTDILLDPYLGLLTQILWLYLLMNCFLSDTKKASLMNMSSEFVPVWQLPSSRDALSGFLRCVVARHQGFISTHRLTVSLKLSGTSPDGTSRKGKETTQSRTVDLAASSKLFEVGPLGCVSCFTVQASQAVGWIQFRHFGNLVKGGCKQCQELNGRLQFR